MMTMLLLRRFLSSKHPHAQLLRIQQWKDAYAVCRNNNINNNNIAVRSHSHSSFEPLTIDRLDPDDVSFNNNAIHNDKIPILFENIHPPTIAIPPRVQLNPIPFSPVANRTIYQLCSGIQSPSGHRSVAIAVIRISGPLALAAFSLLTRRSLNPPPKPRQLLYSTLYHPLTNEIIDSPILATYFAAPRSFTGEDCVEFHVHGNIVIIRAILKALSELPIPVLIGEEVESHNLVEAAAGQFTRRAYENGQLDLLQVEALSDLLNAQTEVQYAQAVHQLHGEWSELYRRWRQSIIRTLAHVEAIIDFGDDEDDVSEHEVLSKIIPALESLRSSFQHHLSDNNRGELIRSGIQLTIFGPPNSGKSSLLNAIASRNVAIVSPIAGTTRDVVETSINIGGYAIVLVDTAGIRKTEDEIEKEGIYRTGERVKGSPLKLVMIDVTKDVDTVVSQMNTVRNSQSEQDYSFSEENWYEHIDSNTIIIFNKCDSLQEWHRVIPNLIQPNLSGKTASLTSFISSHAENKLLSKAMEIIDSKFKSFLESLPNKPAAIIPLSCTTKVGFPLLMRQLEATIKRILAIDESNVFSSTTPVITRTRHRHLIAQSLEFVEEALSHFQRNDIVLAAEAIRCCIQSLGSVVGNVDTEEVLDVVFADFCIGK